MITHILGPFFQDNLANIVNKQKFFAMSFDELLNKIAQKSQMDLVICFCKGRDPVDTRYLTSAFLRGAKATDSGSLYICAYGTRALYEKFDQRINGWAKCKQKIFSRFESGFSLGS